ncbi:MAG: SPOR domain-containing protein [Paludibacter sp.]|nr:SPOR domain-containing protein [Paludibacter sp.]MDD4199348.1 SPOR domain-containing protein [Paludibacter sp.]MDD4429024.1 SPOR domain-containing protein [Paludibacter sp.]
MENIFRNIEKLLANNDHAVVPGLGGFVVQHQPAQISGKYMLPPRATISFNPLISHNDGMLAVEISRENGISYREAAGIAEKETKEFLSKLKTHRKLVFGRLGSFLLENDTHLIFTPATDLSFLPANFGLQELLLPQKATPYRDIVLTIPAKKLMKYAAIFITFVALLFSSHLNESTDIVTKADFSQLNRIDLPEITITPSINTPHQTKRITDEVRTNTNSYKVIVAAFDSEEKARLLCNKLMEEDYPKSEIIVTNNNTRVAIRSFSNIVSAVNYMEQIRRQDNRFTDAWVMKSE